MLRNTVTNTFALIGRAGREQAAATRRLLTKADAADTEKDKAASNVTEEAATPLASTTTGGSSDTSAIAAVTTEVGPDTNAAAESPTNPLTPLSTVVEPTTNAVALVVTVLGTVPGVVAGLPTSETPVADVITSVQQMLTSVIDAAASAPSDLFTLLAGAHVPSATIGQGAGYGVGALGVAAPPLVAPVIGAWPQVLPSADIWDARGDVAAFARAGGVATAGLSEELSISGTAPVATQGITPAGMLPALDHALRALLAPASQLALAALALPGVGGLLIVCAAGIRIGYRQAKTSLMLRASGIARFAGSGPLGVVRSGTLIALRPRAVRVAHPVASRAAGFLDQAA